MTRVMYASVGVAGLLTASIAMPALAQEQGVVADLNTRGGTVEARDVQLTENSKSWKILFDAVVDLSPAPSASGGATYQFNLRTIHPGMDNWSAVSDWAESNPAMTQAILSARDKKGLGLPYGEIDQKYVSAGVYADLAVDDNLRIQDFAYLDVMDLIAAFATAECYRLHEANETQRAIDLAMAEIYVLDQLCDRVFLIEKLHGMRLLTDFLGVVRDQMYSYEDSISIQQYAVDEYVGRDGRERMGISFELPWLRLDLLELPEGDLAVARALIEKVFAGDDLADPIAFADTFAILQAKEAPLTLFGAARRWEWVGLLHGSRIATLEELQIVYDDWWRRWSVRAWHPILEIPTYYERLNPVRFAAVTYSLRDLNDMFHARRQVIAAANGTALAAGLQAYKKRFGSYPDNLEKVYATYIRKRLDLDPYDKEEGGFSYRQVSSPIQIRSAGYDDFITVEGSLLYAKGNDFEGNRGELHSDDGLTGDIVFWPPIHAVAREQGLRRTSR